jgi:hypothetical protein
MTDDDDRVEPIGWELMDEPAPAKPQPEPLPPVESARPLPASKITDELERAIAEAKAAPRPKLDFDTQDIERQAPPTPMPVVLSAPPLAPPPEPPPEPLAHKPLQAIPKLTPAKAGRGGWWITVVLIVAGAVAAIAIVRWRH